MREAKPIQVILPKREVSARSNSVGNSISLKDLLTKDIPILKRKPFPAKNKESFYSELGLLLSTGIDVITAFDIILDDQRNKTRKELLRDIKTKVLSGSKLSEALQSHAEIFSTYETESVRMGEEAGNLGSVLNELSRYYESSIKLRRQAIGVMTYPLIVSSLSIVIVYFMLHFVVPVFADIFKQTGKNLPDITVFLINLSESSGKYFLILFLLVVLSFILHAFEKKKNWYRKVTSQIILSIPILKEIVTKIYIARFCQSMKLLISSKVLLSEALPLIIEMISFYPLENALREIETDVVKRGLSLNESMRKHTIFPSKLVAMIKISEEVNKPEIIYERLYSQNMAELEHQQAVLGKMIEPIFILLLAILVGFILVAMYMPMFEMSTQTF
jgi:type IV pilus assembly protein PilC